MKHKALPSQSLLKELLDYDPDTGEFKWKRRIELDRYDKHWNTLYADKFILPGKCGVYNSVRINGERFLSHRLAWMYVYGEDPGDRFLDHINSVTTDNRIMNLRLVDHSQNGCNKKQLTMMRGKKVTTPYKGIHQGPGGKWRARIQMNGVIHRLGLYNTAEEARDAYNEAAMKIHGEYAKLNAV